MTQPPSVPLEYRGPGEPRPRDPNAPKRFAAALFGGIALSAIAYFAGWSLFPNGTIPLGIAIALLKFGFGLAYVLIPGRRPIGAGLLASLPIGFGIFWGSCAMVQPKM